MDCEAGCEIVSLLGPPIDIELGPPVPLDRKSIKEGTPESGRFRSDFSSDHGVYSLTVIGAPQYLVELVEKPIPVRVGSVFVRTEGAYINLEAVAREAVDSDKPEETVVLRALELLAAAIQSGGLSPHVISGVNLVGSALDALNDVLHPPADEAPADDVVSSRGYFEPKEPDSQDPIPEHFTLYAVQIGE